MTAAASLNDVFRLECPMPSVLAGDRYVPHVEASVPLLQGALRRVALVFGAAVSTYRSSDEARVSDALIRDNALLFAVTADKPICVDIGATLVGGVFGSFCRVRLHLHPVEQ